VCWLVRAQLLKDGFWAPLLYRLALLGTVQISYFFFATYLPVVSPHSLDSLLYGLDQRLFGFEVCLWLDRYISSFTSEWFAFFYFCYFVLLATHTIPILFFSRQQRLVGEFVHGMLVLFCVGQALYVFVPGYGPVRALAPLFKGQYAHGLWLDSVMATVVAGGAQKDIFPSLHTAAPTFLTLFSFRYRHQVPFRYTWAPVGFFAANIVVATMFLRWHWVIDVVAGLMLAGLGWWLGVVVTDWDLQRRDRNHLSPSWPEFGLNRERHRSSGPPGLKTSGS
jgi:membrane-associated phospholipid phosphatase